MFFLRWGMEFPLFWEEKGWGTKMFAQGPATDEVLVCKCLVVSSFNQNQDFLFDMRAKLD